MMSPDFPSSELSGPAWQAPAPVPECGIVLKVWPVGTKLAGKICYDVGLTTGQQIHWAEAWGSGRATVAQYEKGDLVSVLYHGGGQWVIIASAAQDTAAPSKTGGTDTTDPDGRFYSRTDEGGSSYTQNSGTVSVRVVEDAVLRPDDQQYAGERAKKRMIESLPSLIEGPLYQAIYSALLPVVAGAMSSGNVAQAAQLAGLELAGVGVAEGMARMTKLAAIAETVAAARKLVADVTRHVKTALIVYRFVMERMNAGDVLPTGGEISDMLQSSLEEELPRMLRSVVMTSIRTRKPPWKAKSDIAIAAAQQVLMPVIMQIISQILGVM